jgi:Nif-specific regulatory protein
VGRVFESGDAIMVEDLSTDHRFLNRARKRSKADMRGLAYYCVPLIAPGASKSQGVIGTLSAERHLEKEGRTLAMAGDKSFLEKIAAIIADSATLRERLQTVIDYDTEERSAHGVMEGAFHSTMEGGFHGRINSVYYGNIIHPFHSRMEGLIIGNSSAMHEVLTMMKQVAPTDATVLITGESGTGKELFAAEIQRLSRRARGPFVKLNCAALPEGLIESELFGHEKGAFTGAENRRIGRFEMASGGTLFLDEVGDLPPQIQVKLLRVLQEREIERVGGNETIKVDVRLIAATNKKLEEEVKAGRFRDDLYYRLSVFPLRIPPLRERKSDIILLADYFAEKYGAREGREIKRISTPALDLLSSYNWPGNVRELENCIERAVILSTDNVIHSYHLPPSLQSAESSATGLATTLDAALARLEKEMIVESLKMSNGNMAEASRRLGITERRMQLRVSHYAIGWRQYRE